MSQVRSGFGVLVILSLLLAWTSGLGAAEGDSAKLDKLRQRLDAQDAKIIQQNERIAELEADKQFRLAEQDRKISQLETKLTGPAAEQARQAQVKQLVKEIQGDAKSELPKWLDNFKWGGDLRLRYHAEHFGGQTRKERHQGRFRLRIWAKKTWLEKQIEAGFRLASGSSNSPTSTNQSFDTTMSEKDVWIDRAYAKLKPKSIKGLEVVGGKMANPFFNTNVVWDSDVNPEGVWVKYTCPSAAPFEPFVGAGYFLTEESSTGRDGTLSAYQAGIMIPIGEYTEWTTAGTYYDWRNYETTFASAANNTAAGGRLSAEEFDVVNVTTKVKTKVAGVPVSVWFDWAHNTKNVLANNQDKAYGAGVKVGKNKKKGDFSGAYKYAHIEADAVPSGLNDSDFGTTNVRGHEVGVKYNVTNFMTVGAKLFYTQTIIGSNNPRFLGLFDVIFKW